MKLNKREQQVLWKILVDYENLLGESSERDELFANNTYNTIIRKFEI